MNMTALLLTAMLFGCSAYLSATKPPRKEVEVLKVGARRQEIIAALGLPEESARGEDGSRVEAWNFAQGDSNLVKIPKTIFHVLADIGTVGMWEVVGTPVEILLQQASKTYIITYDQDDDVKSVTILGEGGSIEHLGDIGQISRVPSSAAAIGSPLTGDLERGALLGEIPEKQSLKIVGLRFNPLKESGDATIDKGTTPGDYARAIDGLKELCMADNGLFSSDPEVEAKEFRVMDLRSEYGRQIVSFHCKRIGRRKDRSKIHQSPVAR
jgi:hypothetical protein